MDPYLARVWLRTASVVAAAGAMIVGGPAAVAAPGDTTLVSVANDGMQGDDWSGGASTSDDGRYVAFDSSATNLAPNDDGYPDDDVFVRDRVMGTTELISKSLGGDTGNGASYAPSISGDGRFVAFTSAASDLVLGDVNDVSDVFVYDRTTGKMVLASVSSQGVPGNSYNGYPSISDDGTRVAFQSYADNLVIPDLNERADIFVRDLVGQTTTIVSAPPSDPLGADGWSDQAAISGDGTHVAFASSATNLVTGGDASGFQEDIFVSELATGGITLVSVSSSGMRANESSFDPSISDDGGRVAFQSNADNLVEDDANVGADVFLYDRSTSTTTLVSKSYDLQANDSSFYPSISGDGRYVAFASHASNLISDDFNAETDVFLHDTEKGIARRVSISSDGAEANDLSWAPDVADGGVTVAFQSRATNLVVNDNDNWRPDVFVHEVDLKKWPHRQNFNSGGPGPRAPEEPRTRPQHFFVYDDTADGLQKSDPVVGDVHAVANRGGNDKLELGIRVSELAPNCTYTVELVSSTRESNGGLSATAHTGWIRRIGTFTTDSAGDGSFHFEGDPNPNSWTPDYDTYSEQKFGHLDLEDRSGECHEGDGSTVARNELGAAPDPSLDKPFTWFE